MGISRRAFLQTGALAGVSLQFGAGCTSQHKTLNWLTWPGHGIDAVIQPFERQTGFKVQVKEYGSGDLGLIEMSQNPGAYDVITTSMEFIPAYVEAGLLVELQPDLSEGWKQYFPEFKKDIGYNVGGKFYSILYEFGSNGLAYRTDKISFAEASSYQICLDPKVSGKIGLQDWWGNAMGPYSILAGAEPVKGRNPYVLNHNEFLHLQAVMKRGRPLVAGFFEIAGVFSAFANESIWLQPGGGDWVAQLLRDQGVPVASMIPREGGYLWGEGISIVKGTTQRSAAQKFVDYCLSAPAQAAFATKPSYSAIVPNQQAWKLIQMSKPRWAERLNMTSLTGNNAIAPWRNGLIAPRVLPGQGTARDWADAWQAFKAE